MRPHQAVPSSSFADRVYHTANFSSCTKTTPVLETGQYRAPTQTYLEPIRLVLEGPCSVANRARLRSLKAKLVDLLGR